MGTVNVKGVRKMKGHKFEIPAAMQPEVDQLLKGVNEDDKVKVFEEEYVNCFKPIDIPEAYFKRPASMRSGEDYTVEVDMHVVLGEGDDQESYDITAAGNGPINAVANGLLQTQYMSLFKFIHYSEHALNDDFNSYAVCYICIENPVGEQFWGVGIHTDILLAAVNALISAINRREAAELAANN